MERLKIYKAKRGFTNFFIVFGSIFLLVGLGLIIESAMNKTNLEWTSIMFALQGILFVLLGYQNLRSGKYFIEWNDVQVNYLLPNTNGIETIIFSKIKNVRIDLFEIHLDLGESKKVINLDSLQFEHIKSLKQKFEEIRATVENNQS